MNNNENDSGNDFLGDNYLTPHQRDICPLTRQDCLEGDCTFFVSNESFTGCAIPSIASSLKTIANTLKTMSDETWRMKNF